LKKINCLKSCEAGHQIRDGKIAAEKIVVFQSFDRKVKFRLMLMSALQRREDKQLVCHIARKNKNR
jgi:hypothetical protein